MLHMVQYLFGYDALDVYVDPKRLQELFKDPVYQIGQGLHCFGDWEDEASYSIPHPAGLCSLGKFMAW